MSAAGLIDEVQQLGIELEARGERLRYSPAARVPPELLSRLKQHKAEVIEELRRRENPGGAGLGETAPGQLSAPVRHRTGWMVVAVAERRQRALQPLPVLRSDIRRAIRQRKESEAVERWMAELKAGARIMVDREQLATLR